MSTPKGCGAILFYDDDDWVCGVKPKMGALLYCSKCFPYGIAYVSREEATGSTIMNNTPLADSLEANRVALQQQRTPAYGDALRKLRQAERLLRQVLPDWAGSVECRDERPCCEISNRDVVMIRDFLANAKDQTSL